jgi:DNA-binding response OmpR family regulator
MAHLRTKKMSATQAADVLLYVEDDPMIQEFMEITLREAGFNLVIAANGADASAALGKSPGNFRGLITDINLGDGLDGWEVARRARELNHTIAVVYVTGASGHEWKPNGVPHSIVLQKPFAPAQLVVAISSLLMPDTPV